MAITLINLNHSTDRLQQFTRTNAHLRDVQRFSAIDGREISLEDLRRKGLLEGNPNYTPGAIGVFLSHVAQWKEAIETSESKTIAEDDAIFAYGFDASQTALLRGACAEWDLVIWGWNFDAPLLVDLIPGVSPATIQMFQDQLRSGIVEFQLQHLEHNLFKILNFWGLVCYSVSPKGARRLCDFCLPLRPMLIPCPWFVIESRGLDDMMNGVIHEMNAFVCIPPLVVTENCHETSTVRGVTHEYGVKPLEGVWYKDHASGSNRVERLEHDIRLLSAALERVPGNHRYWFYLAQSYRDAGRTAEAAQAYAKRAEMGDWDEEAWNARLQEARCLRTLGDEDGFVRQALAAFNMRPQRAEPLYDLARFYREKGMMDASVLFSEAGLTIERPEQDLLFQEDFVYKAGLQEEYAIAANYAGDPARKDRGFAACNWLALNRAIPDGTRQLARSNLFFYVKPVNAMLPSFAARRVEFDPPSGYRPRNPSVARMDRRVMVMLETVNFELVEDGHRYQTPDDTPIHTRNFLLQLSDDLDIQLVAEILPPADMPELACNLVLGFEDLRLFSWRGELWGLACLRELSTEGWCKQVLARIDAPGDATYRLTNWQVLHPEGPREHERNWMPAVAGDRLQFIYLCDPTRVADDRGSTVTETTPAITTEQFKGGSQLIVFDGGWLTLIHEVLWRPSERLRFYQHRFVWFDEMNTLRRVSRPFFFHKKGTELAAGLAWHSDGERLLISYGVADSEAWIATVSAGDIRGVLEDAEHLPSGKADSSRRLPMN